MRSYRIKILAGIAYEQNHPTGLASALNAQISFLVKSALEMHKIFLRQKLLQITIRNYWCKNLFDRPTGLASPDFTIQFFFQKSALKMCCTKFFFKQKLLQIKNCNFYVL